MQQAMYRFSESYMRSKIRGSIHGAIAFSAFPGLIAVGMTLGGNWDPVVSAGLFAMASIFAIFKNRKLSPQLPRISRMWKWIYPAIRFASMGPMAE